MRIEFATMGWVDESGCVVGIFFLIVNFKEGESAVFCTNLTQLSLYVSLLFMCKGGKLLGINEL